jgi:N-acetyl-anhydromuramyl-L-alanine amidase AmpD
MYKVILLVLALQTVPITRLPLPSKTIRDTTRNVIVIHNDGAGMDARTTHSVLRRRRLAYHYFIDKTGKIYQFVDPKYVAKHAGITWFEGRPSWNNFSIGICLQGRNSTHYTDKQYASLQSLVGMLHQRYPDSRGQRLYTHSEIAFPFGRKKDPGDMFDRTRIRLDSI